jgi:hypothetical protein
MRPFKGTGFGLGALFFVLRTLSFVL